MQSGDEDDRLAISRQNILDPRQKRAYLGVNTGVVRLGAALAPGDDTMQLIVTHKGAARVTLNNGGEKSSMGPADLQGLHLMCDQPFCVCT